MAALDTICEVEELSLVKPIVIKVAACKDEFSICLIFNQQQVDKIT